MTLVRPTLSRSTRIVIRFSERSGRETVPTMLGVIIISIPLRFFDWPSLPNSQGAPVG